MSTQCEWKKVDGQKRIYIYVFRPHREIEREDDKGNCGMKESYRS